MAIKSNTVLVGLHLEATLRGYVDTCAFIQIPPNNVTFKAKSKEKLVNKDGKKHKHYSKNSRDNFESKTGSYISMYNQKQEDNFFIEIIGCNAPNFQLTEDIRRYRHRMNKKAGTAQVQGECRQKQRNLFLSNTSTQRQQSEIADYGTDYRVRVIQIPHYSPFFGKVSL